MTRAANSLSNKPGKYSRTKGPPSYIIMMDNIDDKTDRKEPLRIKGQTVQTEQYYQELFQEVGLEIHRQESKSLNSGYLRVSSWALFLNEEKTLKPKQNEKQVKFQ